MYGVTSAIVASRMMPMMNMKMTAMEKFQSRNIFIGMNCRFVVAASAKKK